MVFQKLSNFLSMATYIESNWQNISENIKMGKSFQFRTTWQELAIPPCDTLPCLLPEPIHSKEQIKEILNFSALNPDSLTLPNKLFLLVKYKDGKIWAKKLHGDNEKIDIEVIFGPNFQRDKQLYLQALSLNKNNVDEYVVGTALGFDNSYTEFIIQHLLAEGKIEFRSFGLCSYVPLK